MGSNGMISEIDCHRPDFTSRLQYCDTCRSSRDGGMFVAPSDVCDATVDDNQRYWRGLVGILLEM